MSADEMPCGCWGHADYEERCRYPKLEQDLSAERKRREEAEGRARDLQVKLEDYMRADKALTVASEKWKARAEKAEWERDAEREAVELSAEDRDSAIQRAERAEADNAALVERMRATQADLDGLRAAIAAEPSGAEKIHAALVAAGVPEDDEVSGFVGLEEHVGRALERMRALEELVQWAASEWCSRYVSPTECGECLACQARTALRTLS